MTRRLRAELPRLKRGDPDAHTDFHLDFSDDAFRIATSIVRDRGGRLHEHDVLESIDDAFMSIFAAAKELPDLTAGYLRIAIYFALTPRLRRGWRDDNRETTLPDDLSEDVDLDEFLRFVDEIFDAAGLTEREKRIVRLRVFDGLDWDAVAKKLGETAAQVRYAYRKALDKLRIWFDRLFCG